MCKSRPEERLFWLFSWISSVPPNRLWDHILNQITITAFQVISNHCSVIILPFHAVSYWTHFLCMVNIHRKLINVTSRLQAREMRVVLLYCGNGLLFLNANFMEQTPWKYDSRLVAQDISCLIRNSCSLDSRLWSLDELPESSPRRDFQFAEVQF
jgi:hypothetical protein